MKFTLPLLFIFLTIFSSGCSSTHSPLKINSHAPWTKVQLLSGDYILLNNLKGKKVVLAFWANWCSQSKQAIVKLNEKAAAFKNRSDIVFLAVNVDKDRELLDSFLSWKGLGNLTVTFSGNDIYDETYVGFKVKSLPYGFIIDEHGVIIDKGPDLNLNLL